VTDALTFSNVVQFPERARAERERVLDIARSAVALLEAALEEGNAGLLREVFAALGDAAAGGDAERRLEGILLRDADVVELRGATKQRHRARGAHET